MLELLAAVVVFGVMSAMAYRGLVSVALTDETLEAESRSLAELQFAISLIERDLRQALVREVRDAYGQPLEPLAGNAAGVALTRAGWSNPLGLARSRLERVGYQYDDQRLLRNGWPVLDRTPGNAPVTDVLLESVETFRLAYLDENLEWRPQWPPPAGLDPEAVERWPRAVSVLLVTARHGRIERVFALVDLPSPVNRQPVVEAPDGEADE